MQTRIKFTVTQSDAPARVLQLRYRTLYPVCAPLRPGCAAPHAAATTKRMLLAGVDVSVQRKISEGMVPATGPVYASALEVVAATWQRQLSSRGIHEKEISNTHCGSHNHLCGWPTGIPLWLFSKLYDAPQMFSSISNQSNRVLTLIWLIVYADKYSHFNGYRICLHLIAFEK